MAHIVLVGAGNMGFAMLKGWKSGTPHRFTVVEPAQQLRDRAAAEGVTALADLGDWHGSADADAIVIATKPDIVGAVCSKAGRALRTGGVVISVAAGKSIRFMTETLGSDAYGVIRCMPNTPASIGEGMIVCCAGEGVSEDQRALTRELMSCIGMTLFLSDEGQMDAVTAVSGSGPAYLFHFVEALTAAAEAAGLDSETASVLAKQTAFGAAKLVMSSDVSPSELRRQVTSPKGTTEAALRVLMDEENGFRPLLEAAVDAAKIRSIELGAATTNA